MIVFQPRKVSNVLLDSKPIKARRTSKHGQQWSGHYDGSLSAGEYELMFEVKAAYIDQDKLIGLHARRLPLDHSSRKRSSRGGGQLEGPIESLDPSIRFTDLILTTNP